MTGMFRNWCCGCPPSDSDCDKTEGQPVQPVHAIKTAAACHKSDSCESSGTYPTLWPKDVGERTTILVPFRHMESTAERLLEQMTFVPNLAMMACPYKAFADGTPNPQLPAGFTPAHFDGANVILLIDGMDAAQTFEVRVFQTWLRQQSAALVVVVVPFMGTATNEREVRPGDIPTANVWASDVSQLTDVVVTIMLHNPMVKAAFKDAVRHLLMEDHLRGAFERLDVEVGVDEPVLAVFPDAGSEKHILPLLGDRPYVTCEKRRDPLAPAKRNVELVGGQRTADTVVAGRHVCIIDDIVQSGATLLACRAMLLAAGAASVSVVIMHVVLPTDDNLATFAAAGFERVIVSNSVPRRVEALARALRSANREAPVIMPIEADVARQLALALRQRRW
jgi:phosphoribosylpyrophosphate synthetase